jgi:hypothetical protein
MKCATDWVPLVWRGPRRKNRVCFNSGLSGVSALYSISVENGMAQPDNSATFRKAESNDNTDETLLRLFMSAFNYRTECESTRTEKEVRTVRLE